MVEGEGNTKVNGARCLALDALKLRRPLGFVLAAVGLVIISAVGGLSSSGCASEEDLVLTLRTTDNAAERQKAAADLAARHSVAATRELASAAALDKAAAEGLVALRNEYVLFIDETVFDARASGKELTAEEVSALQDSVDCLTLIGDAESFEALGALVNDPERAKVQPGGSGRLTPDTLELQLRALEAVAGADATGPAGEAALHQLVETACLAGDAISTIAIRDAAVEALAGRADAVPLLFQARVAAGDDEEMGAIVDSALAAIGEPAVDTLVEAMAEQAWADEILAEIGGPAVEAVTRELDSENARVRYRALGVLLRILPDDEPLVRGILVDGQMVPLLLDARLNATYGDERDEAAETVLGLIGEPAVAPLMALLTTEYWAAGVLASIGEPAVPALTTALASEDRDVRFGAADVLVQIQRTEPASVAALTSDLQDENLEAVASNYAYYIRLGQTGTEGVLAKALHRYGNKEMALDYLNCGNAALDEAARAWADDHGYTVYTEPGTHGGPQWGEDG